MQDIWIPAIVLVANLSAVVVGIVRLTYEINTLQVGIGQKLALAVRSGDGRNKYLAEGAATPEPRCVQLPMLAPLFVSDLLAAIMKAG